MKTYNEINGKLIETKFYYDKGGPSYNGNSTKRGYYVIMQPVERSIHKDSNGKEYEIVTFSAFSGFKYFLLEVNRQSNKSEAAALQILESKKDILLNNFNN